MRVCPYIVIWFLIICDESRALGIDLRVETGLALLPVPSFCVPFSRLHPISCPISTLTYCGAAYLNTRSSVVAANNVISVISRRHMTWRYRLPRLQNMRLLKGICQPFPIYTLLLEPPNYTHPRTCHAVIVFHSGIIS